MPEENIRTTILRNRRSTSIGCSSRRILQIRAAEADKKVSIFVNPKNEETTVEEDN